MMRSTEPNTKTREKSVSQSVSEEWVHSGKVGECLLCWSMDANARLKSQQTPNTRHATLDVDAFAFASSVVSSSVMSLPFCELLDDARVTSPGLMLRPDMRVTSCLWGAV